MGLYQGTMYSDLTSIDYSQINDLVGQVKNAIVANVPFVSVVSDNNPTAPTSTPRVVVLSFGDCSHYLRLDAVGTTVAYIGIRNIANSAYLPSTASIVLQNFALKFVYGPNSFGSNINQSGTGNWIWYLKGSDGHVYCGLGNNFVYYYNTDVACIISRLGYAPLTPSGAAILTPLWILNGSATTGYAQLPMYSSFPGVSGSFYTDGTNYYYCISTTCLVQDG